MLNLSGEECCEVNFKVLIQLFNGLGFLMFEVIHQTRKKSVSSGYPNSGKWVEKQRGAGELFYRLRGVWIPDETVFRVFDLAS